MLWQLISCFQFSIPGRAEQFFCFPEAPDLFSCSPTGKGGRFAVGSCNLQLVSGLRTSEAILPLPATCHYGMLRVDFNFARTAQQTFLYVTIFAEVYSFVALRYYDRDPASEQF